MKPNRWWLCKMDGRFEFGHSIKVAGPTQCGKTVTLCKLLCNKHHFTPCPPKRIMWVVGSKVRDEVTEIKIRSCYPNSKFLYDVPDNETLPDLVEPYDFWVFDDASKELEKHSEFTNMFTKTTHHKPCMLAYLTQNPYEKSGDAVTRSRNCSYTILFRNKNDVRIVKTLGSQLTQSRHVFTNIFDAATKNKNHACLLIDNRPNTPATEQFICNAFDPTPDEPTAFLVPT